MPKVSLVTGGAGFIGTHVSRELVSLGHRVVVLDDLSSGVTSQLPSGVEFVRGSTVDHELVGRLFEEHSFQYVYHLASSFDGDVSQFARQQSYTNTLIGSANLINASVHHQVKCFVFASSIAVYGPGQLPLQESTAAVPQNPYGIAKYAVELDLAAAQRVWGLDSIVFRAHNVYGEHQNLGNPFRNVIGIFIQQHLRGEPFTILGDGTQTRAFTYIKDVAPVLARSVESPAAYNQVFNIGADRPYTVQALARRVHEAMGGSGEPSIQFLPGKPEVLHTYADHSKVREFFSIDAPTSLGAGLTRTALWATTVGSQSPQIDFRFEVERELPALWRDRGCFDSETDVVFAS